MQRYEWKGVVQNAVGLNLMMTLPQNKCRASRHSEKVQELGTLMGARHLQQPFQNAYGLLTSWALNFNERSEVEANLISFFSFFKYFDDIIFHPLLQFASLS